MAVLPQLYVVLVEALEEDLDDLDQVLLQDFSVVLYEGLQNVENVQLILVPVFQSCCVLSDQVQEQLHTCNTNVQETFEGSHLQVKLGLQGAGKTEVFRLNVLQVYLLSGGTAVVGVDYQQSPDEVCEDRSFVFHLTEQAAFEKQNLQEHRQEMDVLRRIALVRELGHDLPGEEGYHL